MTVASSENTLHVGDLEVWYKVTGGGPALVVQSPGWGFGSAFYPQTLKPLEDHFTLLYYDPPGSGRSAALRQEDIQVGTFVEVLEALRRHLGLEMIAPLYFFDPVGPGVAAYREHVRSQPIPLSTFMAAGASDKGFLVRDKLASIRVPTLIIEGRHDFICSPVQAQAIHEGIQGSRLVIFERSGHHPWLEEPEAFFTTLTDFLTRLPDQPVEPSRL